MTAPATYVQQVFGNDAIRELFSQYLLMFGINESPFVRSIKKRKVANVSPGHLQDAYEDGDSVPLDYGAPWDQNETYNDRERRTYQIQVQLNGHTYADELAMSQTYGPREPVRLMKLLRNIHNRSTEKMCTGVFGFGVVDKASSDATRLQTRHQGSVRGARGTVPKAASIAALLSTNVSVNTTDGGGAVGGWNETSQVHTAPTPGDNRVLTEAELLKYLERLWDQSDGTNDVMVYTNLALRKRLSKFPGIVPIQGNQGTREKKMPMTVIGREGFMCEVGMVDYRLNRFMPNDVVYLLKRSRFTLGYMWLNRLRTLPKTANSLSIQIGSDRTLMLDGHEGEHAAILAVS